MAKESAAAAVDTIYQGKASGSVAARLMANGMNPNALRTNDTLRYDEWKQIDKTVLEITKARLVGVNDLISRGLTYNITNGLGTTVLAYEDMSDFSDADINMDASAPGTKDRPEYQIAYLPLPIIHKDFSYNIRALMASRTGGSPLDTTSAAMAGRKVAEKVEEILFCGASSYTFGGGTIRGYLDATYRNTGSLNVHWDHSAATGANMFDDVLRMKAASIADRHYGPRILYIPTAYETHIDDDFKAATSDSIRQRILAIEGIQAIHVADKLTADNIVLVEMSPETVRMVIGMEPTNVEWQTEGGMIFHFKVMTIMVPQIRQDQDHRSGIIHFS
jgi:uncharacterized linocin/CFP29 family protein